MISKFGMIGRISNLSESSKFHSGALPVLSTRVCPLFQVAQVLTDHSNQLSMLHSPITFISRFRIIEVFEYETIISTV